MNLDKRAQEIDGVVVIRHDEIDGQYWEVRGPEKSQRAQTKSLGDVQRMIERWGEGNY